MSKTRNKSLLALALIPAMAVAQLTGLMGAAQPAKASDTGSYHLSATSANFSSLATTFTILGSGFTPSVTGTLTDTVLITVNAPSTSNGNNHSSTISGVDGDTAESAGLTNVLTATAFIDSSGNIATAVSGGSLGASVTIPAGTLPGTYTISLSDSQSDTFNPDANGTAFTVLPSGYSSNVTVSGFTTAAPVQLGGSLLLQAVSVNSSDILTPTLVDAFSGVSFPVSGMNHGAFSPLALTVVSCSGTSVGTTSCQAPNFGAGANGTVFMSVQLSGVSSQIISTLIQDQVFGIKLADAGAAYSQITPVKLDGSLTVLTTSTPNLATGGAPVVSGSGFGDNSIVYFFVVQTSGACTLNQPSNSLAIGMIGEEPAYTAGPDWNGSTGECFLGKQTASSSGTLSAVTLSDLPGSAVLTSTGGAVILAEDVAAGGQEVNKRLNEGTFAPIFISSVATSSSVFTISPTSAAIGDTVTYTVTDGTAGLPVRLDFTANSLGYTTGCTDFAVASSVANSAGVAMGSFTVPSDPCSKQATSSGGNIFNAASNVTITANGTVASTAPTATLAIPATTISASVSGTTATITGAGYQNGETVQVNFVSNQGLSSSSTLGGYPVAGVGGVLNSTIPVPGSLAAGTYTVVGTGASSGFVATGSVSFPQYGGLSCSGGVTVLPGQILPITGNQWAASTTGTLSVNTAPTAVGPVTFSVDATGALTNTSVTIPAGTTAGAYTLVASGTVAGVSGTQTRTCPITVITATRVVMVNGVSSGSAGTGAVGATLPVTGTGFGPNELVDLLLQFPSNGMTVPGFPVKVTASSTGTISTTITVGSSLVTLVPGTYNIVVTGEQTGTPETFTFTVTAATAGAVSNTYFAEGFTGSIATGATANFSETLSILNANNFPTTVTINYALLSSAGVASTKTVGPLPIGAFSVIEESVNNDAGANMQVAASVSSPAPLAVDRIISRTDSTGKALDFSSSLGQQLTNLNTSGTYSYYFAAGALTLANQEYLSIFNPNTSAASVELNVLPQTSGSGSAPVIAAIPLTVNAGARFTENMRAALASAGVSDYGLAITSNYPVAMEQVQYDGDGTGSAKFGAAVTPASTNSGFAFYFAADTGTAASGATATAGTGSDVSNIDVINPAPSNGGPEASVTVACYDNTGASIGSTSVTVDPGTRDTVPVNDLVGAQGGAFSCAVTSDQKIIVERPTFWGGDGSAGGSFASAIVAGAIQPLSDVAFPYLDMGTTAAPINQTVYLYNPGTAQVTVTGVYMANGKSVSPAPTYTVPAGGITAVNVNTDAAKLGASSGVGALFEVAPVTGGSAAIVAEAVSATASYATADAVQGSYPTGATTGQ